MRKVIVISLIFIAIIIIALILTKECLKYNSSIEALLISLLASILVVLIIELITYLMNVSRYSFLSKDFKRIKIFNKIDARAGDTIYEDITNRYNGSVAPLIKIKHHGEGRFTGKANYEEGLLSFELFLDKTNPSYGTGTYQYTKKYKKYALLMPDFGKLETIRDKNDLKKVYIIYQNISPSGIAAGYEIWKK